MPMPDSIDLLARLARRVALGAGLFAGTACGPREAGSVKLPKDFHGSGPMGYGAVSSKRAASGAGNFYPAPGTKKRPSRP